MKKLYTLISAGLLCSLATTAQYSGGTYTAVLPGLWTNNTPTPIWQTSEPAPDCNNCLIQLFPLGGGTIVVNRQLVFEGGTTLVLGSNVTLQIQASNGTSFSIPPMGNYIILNPNGNNTIQVPGGSTIDATSPGLSNYDGIFSASPLPGVNNFTLTKLVGAGPTQQFTNNTPSVAGNALFGTSLIGPATLSGPGSLPIILTSFTATLNQDVVNLAWTTSSEVNADHIAIQRSADAGAHWATIGTEAAKNTTGTPTDYTFTDSNPLAGTSEYRLQLVDKDGTYKYSQIRTIRNSKIAAMNIYPNPARNLVNVTLGGSSMGSVMIRLFNQNGQLMQQRNLNNAGGTTVALSVSGYAEGSYLVVVSAADGTSQITKLLIAK